MLAHFKKESDRIMFAKSGGAGSEDESDTYLANNIPDAYYQHIA